MQPVDPIFVAPRPVRREWGRTDCSDWLDADASQRPVGEIRLLDAGCDGGHASLGRLIAEDVSGMLGDLGRAPPRVRLVQPAVETSIASTSPFSIWTVIDPGKPDSAAARADAYRAGDRVRAYEGAEIKLPAGAVAIEVSGAFQPANEAHDKARLVRLPPVSRRSRATLARDPGLSAEVWTPPKLSWIIPDGETCHVVTALNDGVKLDGRVLRRGEAAFIPAWGRPVELRGEGGRILVAYPDQTPTAVWRHVPGSDPQAGWLPLPGEEPVPAAA